MFAQAATRSVFDVRPFATISLLFVILIQLGSVPMPRISASAPAHQAEAQQQVETVTTTALATGAADWLQIEGIRSHAELQTIAAPAAAIAPQAKEVPGVPMWGTTHMPTRLIVNAAGINVTIEKAEITNGAYETNRGVANWLANASLGKSDTLVFWAYDYGWSNQLDMPFYHLSALNKDTRNDLHPRSILMINDNQGNTWGYMYESMTTVRADDVSWMQQDNANRVILIASAGEVVRDVSGRIVDSTYRRIFVFKRMPLYERAMEGLM